MTKILQELDELFKNLNWNFMIGEHKSEPNTQGAFKLNGFWYLYSNDENGLQTSLGAFTDKEFLYILILELRSLKNGVNIEYDSELLDHIHNTCKTLEAF